MILKAKNLCQSMYFSFPRTDISKIILNTLTKIACKSLTNVDETVRNHIKKRRKLSSFFF